MAIKIGSLFVESTRNLTANYTTTTNKNYLAIGPITIDSGVTLTVTEDSELVIV
jgi:hypothetical protein